MSITFNDIPGNLRVPFVAVEFDATLASQGSQLLAYSGLLIGQSLVTGTAGDDTLHKVTSAEAVATLAGRGSILHRMAIAWFASNTFTELWIGVVPDGGTQAEGTLQIGTGTATAGGTIALYLGGVRIGVAVNVGDDQDAIAAAVVVAVNLLTDLPVTAAAVADLITFTFNNGGLVGNEYDIRLNHNDGEALPAGIPVEVIVPMASGATAPSLTNIIAALGDQWFQVWAHPYNDATSLSAIETELARRFGPTTMIDGVAFTSLAGTFSELSSLGTGRNSPHSSIVAQAGKLPLTPPMEYAAEVGAIAAKEGQKDPARPFQTLALVNARPPAESDLFTLEERNLLLFDGIATSRANVNTAQLDRLITTFQTNASGGDSTAFLDVTTMLTLLFLRYSFRTRMQARYPRHKLADNGTRFGPGQFVITPLIGKAEALGWFREQEERGLVENFAQFKADLVVLRSPSDPNRLEFLLPPDLINQLIVTAAKIQFRL